MLHVTGSEFVMETLKLPYSEDILYATVISCEPNKAGMNIPWEWE